jgi:ribosome biogenesis GTPase
VTDAAVGATVWAAHGRHFWLRTDDDQACVAVSRGRSADVVTGDRVDARLLGAGQAVIDRVRPRRNRVRRSDGRRDKTLAANVDQVAVVLSGEPPFAEELLLRVLVAADREGIDAMLLATKADRPAALASIEPRLNLYAALGYPVLRLATKADPAGTVARLAPHLAGRTTLLVGQSGMGKSTLVNALVPDAELATRAISEALQAGRHTTTFTRMFECGDGGRIIDSPGFQLFGLAHLSTSELEHAMREFAPLLGRCRFHNCSHRHEPGCAILEAVREGRVDPLRHRLFVQVRDQADTG